MIGQVGNAPWNSDIDDHAKNQPVAIASQGTHGTGVL